MSRNCWSPDLPLRIFAFPDPQYHHQSDQSGDNHSPLMVTMMVMMIMHTVAAAAAAATAATETAAEGAGEAAVAAHQVSTVHVVAAVQGRGAE